MKFNKILTIMVTTLSLSPFATMANTLNHEPLNDYFKTLNTEIVQSEEFVTWTQFGPGSAGYSEAVFTHPTDPNVIFNFPDMFNSYRSTDAGATWLSVLDDDYRSLNNDQVSRVYSVDFSRQNPDFGMAATRTGMFVTYNKGESWDRIEVDLAFDRQPTADANMANFTLSAVGVDPNNDQVWYAGSGIFWDVKGNYVDWNSPHGNKPMNAGRYFKTTDAGKTWTYIPNPSSGLPAKAEYGGFYVNPDDSDIVFAHTSYGLYKSTDAGLTYKKIETIEEENGVDKDLVRDMKLIVNPTTKQVELYAINQIRYVPNAQSVDSVGGIVKSLDLGETWINITGDLGMDFAALNEELVSNPDITAAGHKTNFVSMWLYSSGRAFGKYFKGAPYFKNGTEFRKEYPNIPTNLIQGFDRIVVDPTNPNNIYISHNSTHAASMFVGDVWMTKDGGDTWDIATRIGEGWSISAGFWENSGKIAAGTDLSAPNTTSHHMQRDYYEELYSTQSARDLDIAPNGDVYAMFRALTKSTDGGQTWEQTDVQYTSTGSMTGTGGSNLPGSQIVQHPENPEQMFFVSGENKLFKLDSKAHPEVDGRATVSHVYDTPHSPMSLAYLPSDPSVMFMLVMRQAHKGEMLKSVDGGETWDTYATNIYKTDNSNDTTWATPIVIDPKNENNMYFGIPLTTVHANSANLPAKDHKFVGLYKSTDGGKTWEAPADADYAIGNGLPSDQSIYTLKLDPTTNALYAGLTAGASVSIKNGSFAGSIGSWTATGNAKFGKKTLEGFDSLDVAGIGSVKQTVGGLKPNTKYNFTMSTKMEKDGENATLFVSTPAGEVMASADVTSTTMTAANVIFTTGENQTSVTIGLEKTAGDGHLYADNTSLKQAGGLFVSTDNGVNFVAVDIPDAIAHVTDVEFADGKIYITAGDMHGSVSAGGVWVTTENGGWKKLFEMPHTGLLTIDANNPDRLMVAVKRSMMNWDFLNHGVYLSEDAGETWSKINVGFGNTTQIFDLAFDAQSEDILWATHHGSGFFKGEILR